VGVAGGGDALHGDGDLVVISIMGGWLRMFLSTSEALVGDVMIRRQSPNGI
jgi:hypothetical protein